MDLFRGTGCREECVDIDRKDEDEFENDHLVIEKLYLSERTTRGNNRSWKDVSAARLSLHRQVHPKGIMDLSGNVTTT